MNNQSSDIIRLYEAIESITDEQLAIARTTDSFESQYELILIKDKLKQNYMKEITNFTSHNLADIVQDEEISTQIQKCLLSLQAKTSELTNIINELYDQASKSMKQVNTHLKTLHSYGGVNSSDAISYYFDVKK